LIAVFLVLTYLFARWYLCDVRGLCTYEGDKFVGDKIIAIAEILVMVLIAFLIGFALSWFLREQAITSIRQQALRMVGDMESTQEQVHLLEKENQASRKMVTEWQQDAGSTKAKTQALENRMLEEQRSTAAAQEESTLVQRRYENLKRENDELRDTIQQLESRPSTPSPQSAPAVSEKKETEKPVAEKKPEKEKRDIVLSRFTPSTDQVREDLTQISGIGPVIQRKLNEIGIFSFQQISKLSPEDIDQVTNAIKFFPGRIGRDNWIGQAAALMRR